MSSIRDAIETVVRQKLCNLVSASRNPKSLILCHLLSAAWSCMFAHEIRTFTIEQRPPKRHDQIEVSSSGQCKLLRTRLRSVEVRVTFSSNSTIFVTMRQSRRTPHNRKSSKHFGDGREGVVWLDQGC